MYGKMTHEHPNINFAQPPTTQHALVFGPNKVPISRLLLGHTKWQRSPIHQAVGIKNGWNNPTPHTHTFSQQLQIMVST